MFIKEIILDGFKCYEEKTEIRPLDRSFTAITGMNGAGKSNVIDAILFVLGLEGTKLLRANTIKELINLHRKACIATILFCNRDKSRSPIGYAHFDEISISRSVDSEGKSKYYMNNHLCTCASISKFCVNAGLQKNSFFFVVMQGHITKVLNMKSKDLKSLIEETAGTKAYEVEREKALTMMEKKEVKLKDVRDSLQRRIAPLFGRLKEEREAFFTMRDMEEKKQSNMEKMSKIESILFVNEMSHKIKDLQGQVESYIIDYENLNVLEQKMQELQEISSENDFVGIKAALDSELLKVEDMNNSHLEKKLLLRKENLEQCKVPGLHYNLSELQEQEKMLLSELKSSGEKGSTCKFEELSSYKLRKTRLEYKILPLNEILEPVLQQNHPYIYADTIRGKNESEILDLLRNQLSEYSNISVDENDLCEKKNKLRELKGKINYPFLEGVYGTVDENIEILDPKYQEAIYTVLGSRSKHIITADEKIASRLLLMTERKISVIPLSKVRSKPISSGVLKSIRKNKGVNMVCLLKFNETIRKAIEHIFDNYFVFEDKDVARKFCFDHKVICVTLDGTVYDFKGTLTGGKMCYRIDVVRRKDIENLEREITELERRKMIYESRKKAIRDLHACVSRLEVRSADVEELDKLVTKISLLSNIYDNSIDTHKQLDLVRRDIILATTEKNNHAALERKRQALVDEIHTLESEASELNRAKAESLDKIQMYQQMLAEHELKSSTKRMSERQAEGLEPKLKFLIKSTTKLHSSITKLYREIAEKFDKFCDMSSRGDIRMLCNDLLEMPQHACYNEYSENASNISGLEKNDLYGSRYASKWLVSEEEKRVLQDNLGIDAGKLSLACPVISDTQVASLIRLLQAIKYELQKCSTSKCVTMDPHNFDLLEKNELIINDLKAKIQKLESDKILITQSIQKLNDLGIKENEKALKHINSRLGKFLQYFIPNSDANITANEEYEIRVKIGNWKESLGELSGGQKSLVALCLIFSMLSYKPAPFYIFDEIDAALDLSYTQSIGEIIRKEFTNAQFILVSLKNGMYDNANSVFKVYTQDNKSKVCQIK